MKRTAKKGPAKRETRGILKVKKTRGRKAKKVSFKGGKGVMKRREQTEQLYDPYQVDRHTPRIGPYTREEMVGSRGDPQGTQFRLTAAGELIPVRRRKGKIMIV